MHTTTQTHTHVADISQYIWVAVVFSEKKQQQKLAKYPPKSGKLVNPFPATLAEKNLKILRLGSQSTEQ